jgi:GNAT-like C-terminal domain/N-acyltransferase N-terminal domain
VSAGGRRVADDLDLGPSYVPWLTALDALPDPPDTLPDLDWLEQVLVRCRVADRDAAAVRATWPALARSSSLRWVLDRMVALLAARMGDVTGSRMLLPPLPDSVGEIGRCFPAHVFAAATPAVLDFHRRHAVPEAVAWASLRDLGRHMEVYRSTHAQSGVDEPWWLTLHLRGLLYELGRLQFNLLRIGTGALAPTLWYEAGQVEGSRPGLRTGDDALGVHIPGDGPLAAGACDDSLTAARAFFRRHFPSPTRRVAICESWLLDPQLATYLSETTNIVRFQRRFTLTPRWTDGDGDVAQFVFRRTPNNLADVPRRTTLQRALISHLDAGQHWRFRSGWLDLEVNTAH